ncbi:MAG TPA: hypothetical protein VN619_07880 [Lacisediminihabitans sp.]|nr:hypothetical protein [Lacisediminihabitans sp.]HXD61827.1 hypothetical protein [Lacisediminihabitans sp.]
MNWWMLGAVVIGIPLFVYLLQKFRLIDLSGATGRKSSAHGGGLMGIGDEVFAPARHEAALELDRQASLPAPAPLAGDGDKGIFNGKVVIDVSKRD